MNYTRIDTQKLKDDLAKAEALVDEMDKLLTPYAVSLTDPQRLAMPKAREGFDKAGRSLARAMASHPDIGALTEFNPAAVVEDLDNAQALAPLAERLGAIAQRLADTKTTWTAEAWVPSLNVYAVAKVKAKSDGRMKALLEPLQEIFAVMRKKAESKPLA